VRELALALASGTGLASITAGVALAACYARAVRADRRREP